MKNEHRSEPREQVELPVRLAEGGTGTTRDVSATGLFFEIDCEQPLGSAIELTVELNVDGRAMLMKCHGQVVRVEKLDGRTGVAVKMQRSRLEAVE